MRDRIIVQNQHVGQVPLNRHLKQTTHRVAIAFFSGRQSLFTRIKGLRFLIAVHDGNVDMLMNCIGLGTAHSSRVHRLGPTLGRLEPFHIEPMSTECLSNLHIAFIILLQGQHERGNVLHSQISKCFAIDRESGTLWQVPTGKVPQLNHGIIDTVSASGINVFEGGERGHMRWIDGGS